MPESIRTSDRSSGDCERHTRWIAAAFVLYGLVATTLLAINTPPFQVPDEPIQFMRAAQIADGGFIGTRFVKSTPDGRTEIAGGGAIDPALAAAAAPFGALAFHSDVKAKRTDWELNVHWSDARVLTSFPTANYPPLFYLPASAGILVGREFGLSVVQTLYVSRLLTGFVAVALGALAITLADGAAPWLFTILLLPMSLSLMASSSQDALLIACGALAGALLVRGCRRSDSNNGRLLAGLAILLSLIAMARPPFGALALLPLGLPRVKLWQRLLGSVAVIGCTLAWAAIAASTTMSNFGTIVGANPSAQIDLILHQPLLALRAIASTMPLGPYYLVEFIGRLGWLDTLLPYWYYLAATAMLAVAAVAVMVGTSGKAIRPGNYLTVAAGMAFAIFGVFLVLYVTWTPPGHATVEGVEGRYFLAPALAGAVLLPALRQNGTVLHKALIALVCLFPIISLAVTMRALVLRYYLG